MTAKKKTKDTQFKNFKRLETMPFEQFLQLLERYFSSEQINQHVAGPKWSTWAHTFNHNIGQAFVYAEIRLQGTRIYAGQSLAARLARLQSVSQLTNEMLKLLTGEDGRERESPEKISDDIWFYLHKNALAPQSPDNILSIIRQLRNMTDSAICEMKAEIVAQNNNQLITDADNVTADETFRPTLASHVEAMQALFDNGSTRKTTSTLGEATTAMVDRITRIRSGEIDRNAIKTGIAALDRFTGGLHRGEYIILGGRPSMGKTALAVQLAYNIAEGGGGVFYASLEMPVPLLTPRLTSCRLWTPGASVVSYQNLIRGLVSDTEMRWVESAAREMKSWPLVIDDAPGLSAPELEARIQVTKSKMERNGKSLDLVIVDHLHKMRHPNTPSKVNEYTEISSRLAEMAKRLDCPVVALAQLNRGVESRDDKHPQLSDLRESGSIEQDADTVLFTYREAYYLERQRLAGAAAEADRMAELDASRHKLELLIVKQRSGPIETLNLCMPLGLRPLTFIPSRNRNRA